MEQSVRETKTCTATIATVADRRFTSDASNENEDELAQEDLVVVRRVFHADYQDFYWLTRPVVQIDYERKS